MLALCYQGGHMKQKTKRFMFNLPPDIYELLRHHAINRNVSMSNYILQALIRAIKLEVE